MNELCYFGSDINYLGIKFNSEKDERYLKPHQQFLPFVFSSSKFYYRISSVLFHLLKVDVYFGQ